VLVVDDEHVVRQGLVTLVGWQRDMRVVAEAADGEEAIAAYRRCRPDVTLMDLRMPRVGGVAAIAQLRREFPKARFLALTTYAAGYEVARALSAGAQGHLHKGAASSALFAAIRALYAGGRDLPGAVGAPVAYGEVSDAHAAILRMVAQGLRYHEIAERLGIAVGTVKARMTILRKKLGASARTEAVLIAHERGLLRTDRT
jgi:two-component system NarL family response regulator